MKQISLPLRLISLGLLLLFVLSAMLPKSAVKATPLNLATPAAQETCDSTRTIQVTGSAMINVIPDKAVIQLGVQSSGVTPDDVQNINASTMQQVLKALQAQGIETKDISTDIYIIEPVYDNYNSLFIKGYRINNLVAVTLRDIQKTSKLIAAALKADANQVVSVEFYTNDLRKYRDQARELAMQAAREKADALAQTAGAEAGCVLNITENSWSYYNGWWYGASQNQMMTQNVIQNAAQSSTASGNGDEPISLGQISIKAEISASFSLK